MDPLTITTGAIALITTITKVSYEVTIFVKHVRDARSDLDHVSRELLSLKNILELLAEDTEGPSKKLPDGLQNQIGGIIKGCAEVVLEIDKTMKKYEGGGVMKGAKWAMGGREDMSKLQKSLEAHKTALDLALDMVQLTVSKEIKNDTTQLVSDAQVIKTETAAIKADTATLKDDTALILAEIARLQEKVEEAGLRPGGASFMLEKYLDGLTIYAETVIDEAFSDEDDDFEYDSISRPVSRERRARANLPPVSEQPESSQLEQLGLSHSDLEALGAPPSYVEATAVRRAAGAPKTESQEDTETEGGPTAENDLPTSQAPAQESAQETSGTPTSSLDLSPVDSVDSQTETTAAAVTDETPETVAEPSSQVEPTVSSPLNQASLQDDIKAALANLNAQNEASGFNPNDGKNPFVSQLSHFENPDAFPHDVKHIPLPTAPASTEVFLASSVAGPSTQYSASTTKPPVPEQAKPTLSRVTVAPTNPSKVPPAISQSLAQAKGEQYLPNWYSPAVPKQEISENPKSEEAAPSLPVSASPQQQTERPLPSPPPSQTPQIARPFSAEALPAPTEVGNHQNVASLPPRPPKIPHPYELSAEAGYTTQHNILDPSDIYEMSGHELDDSSHYTAPGAVQTPVQIQLPEQYVDSPFSPAAVDVALKPEVPTQTTQESQYHDWGAALAAQHLASREGPFVSPTNQREMKWTSESISPSQVEQVVRQNPRLSVAYQADPVMIQQMIEEKIREQLASQRLAEELAAAENASVMQSQNYTVPIQPVPRMPTGTLASLQASQPMDSIRRSATFDDTASTVSSLRNSRHTRRAARKEYSKSADVLDKVQFQTPARILNRDYGRPELNLPEHKRTIFHGKVVITTREHYFRKLKHYHVISLQPGDRVRVEKTFDGTWWVGRRLADNRVGWFSIAFVDLEHSEYTLDTPTDSLSPIASVQEELAEPKHERAEAGAAPIQPSFFSQALAGTTSAAGRMLQQQVLPYVLDRASSLPIPASITQSISALGSTPSSATPPNTAPNYAAPPSTAAPSSIHQAQLPLLARSSSPLPTPQNNSRTSSPTMHFEPPPIRPSNARSGSHGLNKVVAAHRSNVGKTLGSRASKTEPAPVVQPPRQTAPRRRPAFESQPLVDGHRIVDMNLPGHLSYLTRVDPVLIDAKQINAIDRTEFTHVRCSEVTCSPQDVANDRYQLRSQLFTQQRETKLLVLFEINKHDDAETFVKKLTMVQEAIESLCSPEAGKTIQGWDRWSWKNVVLFILDKGYWKDPLITQTLKDMGLLRDWTSDDEDLENEPGVTDHVAGHPTTVNGEDVKYRLFEHSSIAKPAPKGKIVSIRPGGLPIQTILSTRLHELPDIHLKDPRRNEAIPWINGLSALLRPTLAVYVTSKTDEIPKAGLIKIWKEFETRKVTGKPCSNFPHTAVPTIDFGAFQAGFWRKMFGSSKSSGLEWFDVQPPEPDSVHLKKFQDAIRSAGKQETPSTASPTQQNEKYSWGDIANTARGINTSIPGDTGRTSPTMPSQAPPPPPPVYDHQDKYLVDGTAPRPPVGGVGRPTSFQVRAVFAYQPPLGGGELAFSESQVINVVEELDREWYKGWYRDAMGGFKEGIVPQNFVQRV